MSGLPSYAYPGVGELARREFSFSQAIRVENKIICSGQGGWDRENGNISADVLEEVDKSFDNVEANLKHAGGKGWSQVYRVVTYSTDIQATHQRIIENFKKHMPNHSPVWTEVCVKEFGMPTMHIEIEVEAYDPEGAAEQKQRA
ncbi:hypothetical protein DL765_001865 [Monosporascus sp. GIB2]|nr:hypothetical protein DL765_001865 [Monosporascus sp. GIB2]